MDVDDIVRVVNRGLKPVIIGWDSRSYQLDPGKDSFVPFPAMSNAFGDPRSGDKIEAVRNEKGLVGWVPDRATEVRRLRAKYDNQFGDERVVVNHPNVEVYTLQGDRVLTVLEDQDGSSVIAGQQTVSEMSDQASTVAQLLAKQKQMEEQLQQLMGLKSDEPDIPEDESVTADAIKLQDLTMPPEDTGGDYEFERPQEKTPPEPGSPKVDWKTLTEE